MKRFLTHPYLKKYRLHIAAALLLIAVAIISFRLIWSPSGIVNSSAPDFAALTPAGKSPNWKRSTPQGGSDAGTVYIYSDKIGDVPIKVSQQPLPPSFRDDPSGKVAEIAQGFNATNSMQVDGLSVHIGTSAKGPQSVIFSDGTLLILIKSDETIATGAWADYIKTLE